MYVTLASKITILRILIIPFFIAVVLYYDPAKEYLRDYALAIFMVAVATDALDGYIARRWDQKSEAGAILDPLADKLLLISSFLCLYKVSALYPVFRFPIWLVVPVISRDVILLLGVVIIHMNKGRLVIRPTAWGKATTLFQVLCVVGILMQWPSSEYLWYPTLILTIVSGIDYIATGIKLLNNGIK